MVKHTQTIRRQKPTNCLSVFDHFVGLALEGLKSGCLINFSQLKSFPICDVLREACNLNKI